jgi:probable rRNA maturation factor
VTGEPIPFREFAIANRHPRLRFDRGTVTRLITTLDAAPTAFAVRDPTFLSGELSLVFLTDDALAHLHAEFLDDPTPTDVITFAGDPLLGTAGEICVSADTAARYARQHRRDFSAELTLYLVHGWLHLAGYDDLEPALKRVMRRAETRAMRLVSRAGALPQFSLRPRR